MKTRIAKNFINRKMTKLNINNVGNLLKSKFAHCLFSLHLSLVTLRALILEQFFFNSN